MKDCIFWGKNKLFRSDAFNIYKDSLGFDKLSVKDLDLISKRKRQKVLTLVLSKSKFYQEFYKGIKIKDSFFLDDAFWEDLPILEKQHVREYAKDIFCCNPGSKDVKKVTTGGSTGDPLTSYRDRRFYDEVLQWRMLKRWNVSPAENRLMLWRDTGEYSGMRARLFNQLLWFPTLRIRGDVSVLTEDVMINLFYESNRVAVKIIWGYVGAVFQYANFLLEKNLSYNKSLDCVWVTAAPLSRNQRFIIEKAFGTEVLNQYGCSEVHFIASGVRNNHNLVVEKDYRHLDLVQTDGAIILEEEHGIMGDVLVTDLGNSVFPLIKYRVGDRTSYAKERYGDLRGLPMIEPVKGRVTDDLRMGNGRIISGEYLTTVFDNYVGIVRSFQFIQIDRYSIKIRIVSNSESIENVMLKVVEDLQRIAGNDVDFEWKLVDQIVHDRGKTRYIISRLDDQN